LSPDHPRLVRGFLDLLTAYQDQHTQLYILGDWFNAWIGDDYSAPWLDEIVLALRNFHQAGNQVFFLAGNRDFALGQDFLRQFSGQLLPEVHTFTISTTRYRSEHGDALCTDDVSYQRFRKIIRNPLLLALLRKTPLGFRMKLANGFRKKSRESQQFKSYEVMDVNVRAVEQALKDADILIHGHTHRAALHVLGNKKRIVLGDWKQDHAEILEIQPDQDIETLKLKEWRY
jgi:UDP-2,3-diacylglucosamine hydrolase